MPQLFMDTDQVRSTLSGIYAVQQQMAEQVHSLTAQVDSLVGVAWQAPGAVHFGNDFGYCQQTLLGLLGELEGLVVDLNREIAEWEETGSGFARNASGASRQAYSPRYFSG